MMQKGKGSANHRNRPSKPRVARSSRAGRASATTGKDAASASLGAGEGSTGNPAASRLPAVVGLSWPRCARCGRSADVASAPMGELLAAHCDWRARLEARWVPA